jgi:prepilin-type processing-associated H-X9-DG protein
LPGRRRKVAETHEPETYFRQKPSGALSTRIDDYLMCMGDIGCGARGSRSMIGWLSWSGLSEGAQVGTGSPPWYLLFETWSVRSKVILSIACRHSAVFLHCSSLLRLADPTDRGLPTCERNPTLRATPAVFLRCSGWHATHRMYLWWDGHCSSP